MSLRVLALVPYPLGISPAQRYRIEQWAPHLERIGIHVTFAPFASEATRSVLFQSGRTIAKSALVLRDTLFQAARSLSPRRHDVVLVCREASLVGPAWYEYLASRQRPVVFDFDDAVWMPQEGSVNRRWSFLRAPRKAATICRLASSVVAGNAYLAEYGRRHNDRVAIVPSTVDLGSYGAPKTHSATAMPVVGWTGSHTTLDYLRVILPALAAAARRRPFRLLVIGAPLAPFDGLQIESRPWSAARERDDLLEMDVGLMPLPDDEWTRGKCALKAIQYLGVGVPVVASPIGAACDVVLPGETGLHATADVEWSDAIVRLLESASERERMGRAGRALVEKSFSADVQAARFGEVLIAARETP